MAMRSDRIVWLWFGSCTGCGAGLERVGSATISSTPTILRATLVGVGGC